MTTFEFLSDLRRRDVRVWAENGRLRCSAPHGVLTADLQRELATRKPELLAFLHAAEAWTERPSAVVPVQPLGSKPPFFGVPGHNGDVFCYVPLSRRLGLDQPFYALEPPGVDGHQPPLRRIEELAAYLVKELRGFQPEGPYRLGGYCLGGLVAFEMAQQLREMGQQVPLLVLLDTMCPTAFEGRHRLSRMVLRRGRSVIRHLRALVGPRAQNRLGYVRQRVTQARALATERHRQRHTPAPGDIVIAATTEAARRYRPQVYPGRLHLFLSSAEAIRLGYGRPIDWDLFAGGGTWVYLGPSGCTFDTMVVEPYVGVFADALRECLAQS